MSDHLRQDLIDITFADGEQPSGEKLTSAFGRMNSAIELIDEAIGDLYSGQSRTYSLDRMKSVGPNIARLLGSAGALNPIQPGLTRVTGRTVTFTTAAKTIDGYSHYAFRQFILPYPPIVITSDPGDEFITYSNTFSLATPTYWDITADGGGAAVNKKADLDEVDSTGDFHVSDDGIITTYTPITSDLTIEYTFDTLWDSYTGSSWNVIPDFAQTTALCTVATGDSITYGIVFPAITDSYGSADLTTEEDHLPYSPWNGTNYKPMKDQYYVLPHYITDGLTLGDTIPDGYIQIYDEDTDSILLGGIFTYVNESELLVTNLSLETSSDRYRIIVPGTNIAELLRTLRESYLYHNHSGKIGDSGVSYGTRISHTDLLNQVDEGDSSRGGYTVSTLGPSMNPHPQYLHRDGYKYGISQDDDGNTHNAMLGNLVLAATDGDIDNGADGYSIVFGGISTGADLFYSSTAPDGLRLLLASGQDFSIEGGNIVLACTDGDWDTSEDTRQIQFGSSSRAIYARDEIGYPTGIIADLNAANIASSESLIVRKGHVTLSAEDGDFDLAEDSYSLKFGSPATGPRLSFQQSAPDGLLATLGTGQDFLVKDGNVILSATDGDFDNAIDSYALKFGGDSSGPSLSYEKVIYLAGGGGLVIDTDSDRNIKFRVPSGGTDLDFVFTDADSPEVDLDTLYIKKLDKLDLWADYTTGTNVDSPSLYFTGGYSNSEKKNYIKFNSSLPGTLNIGGDSYLEIDNQLILQSGANVTGTIESDSTITTTSNITTTSVGDIRTNGTGNIVSAGYMYATGNLYTTNGNIYTTNGYVQAPTLKPTDSIYTPSPPIADTIYKNSIIKSWAKIVTGIGGPLVSKGFNINSTSTVYNTTEVQVDFWRDPPDANYTVIITLDRLTTDSRVATVKSQTATNFGIQVWESNPDDGASHDHLDIVDLSTTTVNLHVMCIW
jgi:hypothetical protein